MEPKVEEWKTISAEDAFAVVRLASWEQLRTIVRNWDRWIFRGHGDSRWHLTPTLERILPNDTSIGLFLRGTEEDNLWEFQRRAHEYYPDVPVETRRLEWLALMQHHGAPTRLLDFTRSLYVASFFAFIEATDHDVAIYAVNESLVSAPLAMIAPERFESRADHIRETETWFDEDFTGLRNWTRPLVVVAEPWRLSPRLAAQQGTFLCSVGHAAALESNLFGMYGVDLSKIREIEAQANLSDSIKSTVWDHRLVVKFLLPASERDGVVAELRRMNVTYTSLFPGLDGYARDIKSRRLVGYRP